MAILENLNNTKVFATNPDTLPQEPLIMSGTVRINLLLCYDSEDTKIITALKEFYLW